MIKFKNKEHGKFYERCLGLCGCSDPYHRAFFYTMGISSETRMHIHDCFNFRDDVIRPDCLSRGWQTSGSSRVTRMAFNLWNGWNSDGLATPYELFATSDASFMLEAIRLRYPEFWRDSQIHSMTEAR